jgi:flagellar motor switch protein FliM
MTDVLSQEEIDQLLTAINAGDAGPEDFRPAHDYHKIKIYDFKRPDKFSKEQIRTVSIIHESYARDVTSIFSSCFRMGVHVHVASVDQLAYEEFIRAIPTPTTLIVADMEPLRGNILLEIDPAITGAMLNRIFGGAGECPRKQHELTELEARALEETFQNTVAALKKAWAAIVPINPKVVRVETNPQFTQIAPPGEMVVLITLEAKFGETEGMINVCFPHLALEPVMPRLSAAFWYGTAERRMRGPAERIDVNEIPILMKAELFSRVCRVDDILGWKRKAVIYPHEKTDLTKCRIKIGDYVTFVAGIINDKSIYSRRIIIENLAEPYKERYMQDKSSLTGEFDAPGIAGALKDVNIQISVELGRTRKLIKEILEMGEGTIVELDKLAGEPVDILANNVVVAKGEVVVIDENFGVRVTELANGQKPDNPER